MPYIAFLALWSLIDTAKKHLTWFAKIGSLSMFIYLTHPLIFQLLLRIIPNSNLSQTEYGFIILILTTTISIVISWCMQKAVKAIPIVNKYL